MADMPVPVRDVDLRLESGIREGRRRDREGRALASFYLFSILLSLLSSLRSLYAFFGQYKTLTL